jgi:hypothetical protein
MRKIALACVLGAQAFHPVAAHAAAKDFALQGYALPAGKAVTIVLIRPDVNVGELQGGGLPQPNADWTNQARDQIEKALKGELAGRKSAFVSMEERVAAAVPTEQGAGPASARADVVEQYRVLHTAVVDSILAHQYNTPGRGGKLPTKTNNFAYTMGPGTSELGRISGANYGLFVMTNDQFASDSRKAMQVAGALGCLIGVCVLVSGGTHVSYVSMVEFETGNVVWFNLQRGSKGDVRNEAGAQEMAKAILARMPSRPGERMAIPKVVRR